MTTPTFKSRFIFHLPDYWTPEQALAVTSSSAICVRRSGVTTLTSSSIFIAS